MDKTTISKKKHLFLLGMPGVGKTTLGYWVANAIGYGWVDMDDRIRQRMHRKVEDIIIDEGEAYFREIERVCMEEVMIGDSRVVSCGGGVVMIPGMMDRMRQQGVTVYLKANIETLVKRLEKSGRIRPLVGEMVEDGLVRLYGQRRHLYEQADYTLSTDGCEPKESVLKIVEYFSF